MAHRRWIWSLKTDIFLCLDVDVIHESFVFMHTMHVCLSTFFIVHVWNVQGTFWIVWREFLNNNCKKRFLGEILICYLVFSAAWKSKIKMLKTTTNRQDLKFRRCHIAAWSVRPVAAIPHSEMASPVQINWNECQYNRAAQWLWTFCEANGAANNKTQWYCPVFHAGGLPVRRSCEYFLRVTWTQAHNRQRSRAAERLWALLRPARLTSSPCQRPQLPVKVSYNPCFSHTRAHTHAHMARVWVCARTCVLQPMLFTHTYMHTLTHTGNVQACMCGHRWETSIIQMTL